MTGILLAGCECVRELDTPVDIVPEDFANVAFINSVPGSGSLKVEAEGLEAVDGASFTENNIDYEEFAAGTPAISVEDASGKILFNGLAEFEKARLYSAVLYRNIFYNDLMIFNDQGIRPGSCRLINTLNETAEVEVSSGGITLADSLLDHGGNILLGPKENGYTIKLKIAGSLKPASEYSIQKANAYLKNIIIIINNEELSIREVDCSLPG
ncbi:MAG: hypothetical protein ACOC2K_00980 [Bacteroidota bacterium]